MPLPPLHPILVNFTAALVPISVVADVLSRVTGRASLRSTAWWTLVFATAITPLTALAGWLWLAQMGGSDQQQMPIHKWLGTGLAVAFVVLLIWRSRIYRRDERPGIGYLAFAGLMVLALIVQGHLGGTMSFGGGSETSTATEHSHNQATPPTGPQWRDYIEIGHHP